MKGFEERQFGAVWKGLERVLTYCERLFKAFRDWSLKHILSLNVYGEYRFALAPNEQKVWKNFLNESVFKVAKFYLREYWFVIPLFGSFYPLKKWAEKKNESIYRKKPEKFINDE
ncbi:unnamed protein product [Enterobius vermicularis]|uniref:Cytochrome b-c1 complex subunit 8 n=1 Tax=Enterobius vermicularis TaxID=51028 RepID=A0A0N4V1V0_ENTVE|nr:unnamed protein product [Enterobius vermicularis]